VQHEEESVKRYAALAGATLGVLLLWRAVRVLEARVTAFEAVLHGPLDEPWSAPEDVYVSQTWTR
jgi:hypothetical protein